VPLSIGFLSTYRPTQCGQATFTASLRVARRHRELAHTLFATRQREAATSTVLAR
jgi:hypothetical protein